MHHLSKPLNVMGETVSTFEDAAYRVRQHVITDYNSDGRALVRSLKEADSLIEGYLAEDAMTVWLQERGQITTIDVHFSRL